MPRNFIVTGWVALYVYGYAGGNQLAVKKNAGAAGGLLQLMK